MITKDNIKKAFNSDDPVDEMAVVAETLLEERDAALRRAEAYRDVARLSGHVCHQPNCLCGIQVDQEAAKLMAGEGK